VPWVRANYGVVGDDPRRDAYCHRAMRAGSVPSWKHAFAFYDFLELQSVVKTNCIE